jgi:hypothetical protein
MSENLIESVEPLLTPPVTRHPTGISGSSDDDGVYAAATIVCAAFDEGDE